jgi:hypothetical protein
MLTGPESADRRGRIMVTGARSAFHGYLFKRRVGMTTEEKFKPVAELMRQQLQFCLMRARPVEATQAITRLANDLTVLIVDKYPRFDRGKFLKECGIDNALLERCGLPTLGEKA